MKYREDIDGLRAIAVISVVIFHAFPKLIPGGFIGVDVFFVISGFLITGIILEELKNDAFSLIGFYKRRIKRIFPALITILIFVLAIGWLILLPEDYGQVGLHAGASGLFFTNFVLFQEIGYFNNDSITKPLLHLWSLAVEEQFYLFWPLILIFFQSSRKIFFATISIFLVSLIFSVTYQDVNPEGNFFLPFGRFWELMSGSILAITFIRYKSNTSKNFLKDFFTDTGNFSLIRNLFSLVGIFLLFMGFFVIKEDESFPGLWPLLPIFGTVLLIVSGPRTLINKYFLSNKLLVGIGLISYPLYLWHWPLLSYMYIIKGESLHKDLKIIAIVLSILLSWITYRFVEKTFRYKSSSSKIFILIFSLIGMAAFGFYVAINKGIESREIIQTSDVNREFQKFEYELNHECGLPRDIIGNYESCKLDSRGNVKYAMIGDSKASVLINGVMRTSTEKGRWLFIGGNKGWGSPAPFISNLPRFKKYQNLIFPALDAVIQNKEIEVVTLVTAARTVGNFGTSGNWLDALDSNEYADAEKAFNNVVDILVKNKRKVVLIVDNPSLGSRKTCVSRKIFLDYESGKANDCELGLDDYFRLRTKYMNVLKNIKKNYPENVFIFDTYNLVCDLEKQKCLREIDGNPVFSYSDHISDYVAGKVGRKLNEFINNKVQQSIDR